jgi:CubicO group peptidase (beta-lactamase class C family)
LGTFFQEEIARRLDIEFYIGLPASIAEERVAQIKDFRPIQLLFHLSQLPWPFVVGVMTPGSLAERSFKNPRFSRPADVVRPPYRGVEIPAANGIGQVRAIARAYAEFATGGARLGLQRRTLEALMEPATPAAASPRDEILRIPTRYALGFLKPCPACHFGCSDSAFGAPGLGGSFGFADPDSGVGFAYAPNRSGFYLVNDPREKALRDVVYQCLS